jgi:mycothiol synthase
MTVLVPEPFTHRPPTMADAEAVAAVITACQAAEGTTTPVTAEEVRDDWAGVDLASEAMVILDPGDCVVACADIMNQADVVISVYGYVHPEVAGRGLGKVLVEWGEEWARGRVEHAPAGTRVVAQHFLNGQNQAAAEIVADAGYQPVRQTWIMAIDLDAALPEPALPPGISIRTFRPGEDDRATFEAVEEAFVDLWGRPRGTFDGFTAMTESETFDPSLWLLAVDQERMAGVVLGKTYSGDGWIDTVGVRRPWRRQGLGLALLHRTFAAYRARGITRVELSVDAQSGTGAPRLYDRAGMRIERHHQRWHKELRPGVAWMGQGDAGALEGGSSATPDEPPSTP